MTEEEYRIEEAAIEAEYQEAMASAKEMDRGNRVIVEYDAHWTKVFALDALGNRFEDEREDKDAWMELNFRRYRRGEA
ncbi:MAG: hypothetical protein M0R06_01300 [Sphaerochaeta sp.]|nr:hypothetical protein [Sphaerochaeta sp.]